MLNKWKKLINEYGNGIQKKCENCVNGKKITNSDVICSLYGLIDGLSCCKKYRYNLLLHKSKKMPKLPHYDKSDFEL